MAKAKYRRVGIIHNEFTGEDMPIIDMTVERMFTIGESDPIKGKKGDQQFCMEARAVNRSNGVDPDNEDEVRAKGARVFKHGVVLLPMSHPRIGHYMGRFVGPAMGNGYDKGVEFVGQTFTLRPPSESQTLITKRLKNLTRSKKPKGKHPRKAGRQVRENWGYKTV